MGLGGFIVDPLTRWLCLIELDRNECSHENAQPSPAPLQTKPIWNEILKARKRSNQMNEQTYLDYEDDEKHMEAQ